MGNSLSFLSNPIIGIRKGGNCLRANHLGEECSESRGVRKKSLRKVR